MNIEKLKSEIQAHASLPVAGDEEDFNPWDYSGGNFDDAYSVGVGDGYRLFARELLECLD